MKARYLLIIVMLICCTAGLNAQTYNMSSTPVTTCAGTFYDNGGTGNYGNNAGITQTFTSADGNRISFAFTSFSTESCCDYMDVWDGPTTAYPYIGRFAGGNSPGTIISTGASLTFYFYSDVSVTAGGWTANISCTTPPLTVYNMNTGTDVSCSGVFYDNGGAAANYPNNENRVHTFCSGTSDMLQFTFTQSSFNLAGSDSLFIYDGSTTSVSPIAVYTAGSVTETITSSGTCLTYLFKSNGTGTSTGWSAPFNCVSTVPAASNYVMSSGIRYTCGGTFTDAGGTGGNYGNNESKQMTLASYNGNRISVNFQSFSTESCCDYMDIWDGPTTAYPYLGRFRGTASPGIITSTGTALTFYFYSDAGTTASGWLANISCTTPPLTVYNMNTGTATTCSGVFYDNGGAAANYPNNENRIQAFCSNNGEFLQFTFTQTAFNLSGNDSLFIYDGATTSSAPIAVYTAGSVAEVITSTGTCLTYKFKSDGTTNTTGWQAQFVCTPTTPAASNYVMSSGIRYTCGGTFSDAGGTGGNYGNNESKQMTLASYNGNRITVNFQSFSTESCCDFMDIWDGPSTAYPYLGRFKGTASPGSITSTGTALTFYFYSDASNTSSGWLANISCTTPPLTVYNMSSGTASTCSGVFYDNGGANTNYPNNENRIQTFCSNNGEFLQFTFTQTAFNLSANDSLFIYDGATTSSAPIAVYTAGSVTEIITSSGTCLTYKFKSDGTTNTTGWQAQFACTPTTPAASNYVMSSGIRYTCGGTFSDAGGTGGNYGSNESKLMTLASYNGNRISLNFQSFATESCCDYMDIWDGPNTAYPYLGRFKGTASPGIITSTGTALTFFFYSDASNTASGWLANISCTTPPLTVYNMSSGTANTCSGVFYDNGGANANYPNNENRTQTFCSNNGEFLQFTSTPTSFNLSNNDSLFIYDGANASPQPIAVYTAGSVTEVITSTGTCLTYVFKSDGTTNTTGWQAQFACTPTVPPASNYVMSSGIRYTCGGTFTDAGAGGNYGNSESKLMTFVSNNGSRLSFNFQSFATENCCDYMDIYDGPSTAYPYLGRFKGGASPGTVLSTGSALTFYFYSDAGTTAAGWLANITCTTPALTVYNMSSGTVNACSGAFYDNGGAAANYPNNENRTQTFCSNNGQFLQFVFTQTAFNLAASDSLFIYDGPSTASQPIAVYTAGSIAESITSTGTCLTFRFKSDAATSTTGWQAQFNCTSTPAPAPVFSMSSGIRYTCGATFHDDGGPTGNYNDFASHTQTFVSTGGCALRATFTSFNTSSATDYLRIYDGPTTASTLIGTYSGATSPGVVQASGTALTFQFIVNSGGSSAAGWVANLTCPSQAAPPVVTSNSPVCEGSAMQLNANNSTPGVTYNWTGPNGFTSSQQNPSIGSSTLTAAGTYSVTATIAGCTSNQSTTTILVDALPAAPAASNNGPLCSGSSLSLASTTVTGATAYAWSGPNSFTSSQQNPSIPNASAAATGTYTVTATAGACTVQGTTAVTVTQTPSVPAVTSNSPVCSGNTVTLTASSSGAASYSWSGPNGFTSSQQNPVITNATSAESGTYTVTATNGSCTSQSTVNVTVNPSPTPPTVASNSPLCAGSALNLTSSTIAGATYSWSGPNSFTSASQSPSIANVTTAATGTYTLTATVGGCSVQSTTSVTVNASPSLPTVSSNSPICSGNTISLTANATGATSYAWNGPNGFTSSQQNPVISNVTPAESGTYTVTASNGSCTSQSTVNVTVNSSPPAPALASNSPLCEGSALNLTSSTVAGATYAWAGPNGFTSSSQNPSISNVTSAASGTYTLTVSTGACTAQSTITATVNPAPAAPATSTNSPVCSGSSISLSATAAVGATYAWSGPNGFTSTSPSFSIPNAGFADAGTYTVIATLSGCSSTPIGVNVIVNTVTPTAASNSPVCSGNMLSLSASNISGATYTWSGPNGFTATSQNPVITNASMAESGTYTVTATIGSCLSQPATVSVTVNQTPSAPTAGNSGPVCAGSPLNLSASTVAGATYSWSGPNGYSSSQQNPVLGSPSVGASGAYNVTATVGGCTSAVASTIVTINNPPASPSASSSGPVCEGSAINLFASAVSGASYSWSGPNGFSSTQQNPVINPAAASAAGTYTVTATVNGCSSSSTVNVSIYPSPAAPVITWNQMMGIISSSYIFDNQWYLNGNILTGETGQDLFYSLYSNTGPYTVTYTDGNGCTSTSAPFNFTVTSVADAAAMMNVSVYPNPNDGAFTIELRAADDKEYVVTMIDAVGQVVFSEEARAVNGSYTRTFNRNDLAKGIYTLSIRSGADATVKMIVIQ
jgi:hypothetical protein